MSQQENVRNAIPSNGRTSSETTLSDILEEFDRWALFLDIDGTLIDLAPTPDAVVVPAGLPVTLDAVSKKLGGALALVTGRALPYADTLFSPKTFPIAGLHGAERRTFDGIVDRVTVTPAFEALKARLVADTAGWSGVLIEDKGAAVGAHYRQAPERHAELDAMMERAAAEIGDNFTLQRGKMVIEIRPARASKGEAVRAFLTETPFTGRLPVTIGDDLTDEAMFRTANSLGGISVRVGGPDLADGTTSQASRFLTSADELRNILAGLAR